MGCTGKRERMKKYESLSENMGEIKNLFPLLLRGKDQSLRDGSNISNY